MPKSSAPPRPERPGWGFAQSPDSVDKSRGILWECALFALVSGVGAALVAVVTGIPAPYNHDQFAYLLLGDTFASGRLANPTPPFWEHFETFHVLFEPTYVSKYPVGQGLALALGQVLFGAPIVGVWLTVALFTGASCWALHGWLDTKWARLGSVIVLLQWGIVGYWAQSYWGGAVAGLGGALVCGALPRLLRRPSAGLAVTMGFGFSVLANTRPLEGALLTACTMVPISIRMVGHATFRRAFLRAVLPIWLVLGTVTIVGMGIYNVATTHSWTTMPYQLHSRLYSNTTMVPWKELPPPPEYRHQVFEDFYETWSLGYVQELRTFRGFVRLALGKMGRNMVEFLGPGAFIALLGLPGILRRHRWQWAFVTCAAVFGPLLFTRAYAHYLAPISILIVGLYVAALARLETYDRRLVRGRLLVAISIAFVIATFVVRLRWAVDGTSTFQAAFQAERARVIGILETDPAPDLVFVDYDPGHNPHQEWVYNRASILESDIVWARDLGDSLDTRLIDRLDGRAVWSLKVGPDPADSTAEVAVLRPYSSDGGQ